MRMSASLGVSSAENHEAFGDWEKQRNFADEARECVANIEKRRIEMLAEEEAEKERQRQKNEACDRDMFRRFSPPKLLTMFDGNSPSAGGAGTEAVTDGKKGCCVVL